MQQALKQFINKVIVGDCVETLRKLPSDSIDLIIVDPPYNLGKPYNAYYDELKDEEYLQWSYKWLRECVRVLKPTGSLFIINLPKWALYYMLYLNKLLHPFRIIAWYGLSEPRGKIMPAHYTILWYVKDVNKFKLNREVANTMRLHPRYVCLRLRCKQQVGKLQLGEPLTDVWYDIHRVKHRSKRVDRHPCQLPEKLLERMILLTTDVGDIVLDPMCGVGTTLVVAKRLQRRYIGIDIDPEYVKLAQSRLEEIL